MNVVPLRGLPDQDRLPFSGSELRRAIGSCRQAFIGVALMSGTINLLYLIPTRGLANSLGLPKSSRVRIDGGEGEIRHATGAYTSRGL